ncbi:NUDIX hydrolase [Streptomyces soliscabiei]|uniref:NUDIX hydrolase n=1 Tax=Streptomyces soliscabiei TaxID=588897 RepID=UPI0029A3FC23|nr:NUDIX domain-containing protein [Streptomyces sp. NY05-11A]MDX2680056.1 NUDIX domain-containing protein [Streptomyces sp. NY05-11A]
MTSPLSSSDHGAPRATLSAAQYAASRHAVWLGAAAIVTDQVGRVLLVHPTYRADGRWLLPGGVVEPGEHPHVACRREITEELGLPEVPLAGVLAVHSLSPHHADIRPGMPCPGEIRYVFDGGSLTPDQVEAIRLPREELSEFAFFETRDAVQRLRPVDGQIMLAAYRARLGNTATAHLADGRHILDVPALDRHDVHVRYRPLWDSPLNRAPVPERLPVQQAWAWCFVPDGRVVLVADPGPRGALPMLPGGTVEKTDTTPEDTLHREAAEEAQLTLTDPVRLGWVLDETGEVYGGVGPNARLRLAAQVTAIGPAAVDPATGHPFARLLVSPVQAAALLGWGPPGERQARLAAETARERWALPTAGRTRIEEVPVEGMRLS